MVMVEVVHLTNQHQSLAQVGAEEDPFLQINLSVPIVAKFTKEMFAQLGDLSVSDATKEDILRQCAIHPRDPYVLPLNPRLCIKFKPMMTKTLVKLKMLT